MKRERGERKGHWCWPSNFEHRKVQMRSLRKKPQRIKIKLLMEVYTGWEKDHKHSACAAHIIRSSRFLQLALGSLALGNLKRMKSLRQRPFIHIECFIKKEVITVYFIHNYLWGYKPINREHFVFFFDKHAHFTMQRKNKRRRAERAIKIRPRMDFFQKQKKQKTFWLLTLKLSHTR